MLALACVLFSFSAVRARVDDYRFEQFIDAAGTPGPSMVFVTTAADCLALVEDVNDLAGQLTVPTRILIIEDGVSTSDLEKLVAANSGDALLEPILWRSVMPIGRFVRTPFAVGFDEQGSVTFVQSIGGQEDLTAASLEERFGAS
ncbi:MAG: hypothetical protein OXI83_05250 [Gemmatimonadota bacterium]|nr:hypothetical protein [Gemmatimonadota bacterium]